MNWPLVNLEEFCDSLVVLLFLGFPGGSALMNANSPTQTIPVRSLGRDSLAKELATYRCIFAWKSHGQESLQGYSTWGRKRVGRDLATNNNLRKNKHFSGFEVI